jgi:hypothetical protein
LLFRTKTNREFFTCDRRDPQQETATKTLCGLDVLRFNDGRKTKNKKNQEKTKKKGNGGNSGSGAGTRKRE